MNNGAIGVFDSGLGGLSAVRELKRILPSESIIYFGDTARVPYGGKSEDVIVKYALQDMRFLLKHNVKAILVACGTVSSVAMTALRNATDTPIVGVVEAAASAAERASKNRKIAVLGTAATVKSRSYEKILKNKDSALDIVAKPCPLFVPLVESGHISPKDKLTALAAEEYLSDVRRFGADTVILGCTHYPIIKDAIARKLRRGVSLIDTGKEAAIELARTLREADMLCEEGRDEDGIAR